MKLKIYRGLRLVFLFISIVYLFVAAWDILNLRIGDGDEYLFISDLNLIKQAGWIFAIAKGVSIPYMIVSYPFSLVFEDYLALRYANVFLLSLFLFYLYSIDKKSFWVFLPYLLFFISTVSYFYYGTNDSLFFISLTVFLIETYRYTKHSDYNLSLALSALVVAIFTRAMFVVYLPVILFGLFLIFKSKEPYKKAIYFPVILFVFLLILNIPAIISKGSLSYDEKNPPDNVEVTWAQRQYLAQLLINDGKLERAQHPSWEETQAYIDKFGMESLPENTVKSIFFDFELTIREFFKDMFITFYLSFRGISLMFVFAMWFIIHHYIKYRIVRLQFFPPIALLVMIAVFSFIIISNVELRWLCPVFLLTMVFYKDLEISKSLPTPMLSLNYFLLVSMSFYGIGRILDYL